MQYARLYEPDVRSYISSFSRARCKVDRCNHVASLGWRGTACKKKSSHFVDQIHAEYDNVVVLKLSKELLGTESEVMLLGSYIPPAKSVYYKETEITNGLSLTEQCIIELYDLWVIFP